MSDYLYLVIILVLINVLQSMVIRNLIKKTSEHEDILKKVDDIVSPPKKEHPLVPDSRRPMEWKIKR